MSTTYCALLNSSELSGTAKLDRWKRYVEKVLNLQPTPLPPPPLPKPVASSGGLIVQTATCNGRPDGKYSVRMKGIASMPQGTFLNILVDLQESGSTQLECMCWSRAQPADGINRRGDCKRFGRDPYETAWTSVTLSYLFGLKPSVIAHVTGYIHDEPDAKILMSTAYLKLTIPCS